MDIDSFAPDLPLKFSNPDEYLKRGYEEAVKSIKLKELAGNANFKLWIEMVEIRWLTCRDLALSDMTPEDKRARYRAGAAELGRQLNTLYTAIGKANEMKDPKSLLNKELKQKIKDIEEYQRMQRRP